MIKEDFISIYQDSFRINFDLPAVGDYGSAKVLTYGQFASHLAYMHLLFKQCGVKAGDKVALMGRNSEAWITVFMATITYGAVVVPIQPDFTPTDAAHIINHSDAILLFVAQSIWEHLDFESMPYLRGAISLDKKTLLAQRQPDPDKPTMEKILKGLRRCFSRKYPDGFTAANIQYKRFPKDAVCILNYTSGTTGFSKGVMMTHNNMAANVVYGRSVGLYRRGSRNLAFLPLAHTFGCTCDMLVPLACGATVTAFSKLPSPMLLMKAFAEVKPTTIITVPLIIEKIYKKMVAPLVQKRPVRWALEIPKLDKMVGAKLLRRLNDAFGNRFERVMFGGAPLNPEVEDFLLRIGFPLCGGYGMTECGPLISIAMCDDYKAHSVGTLLHGMLEYRIERQPDTDGDDVGELVVRGETVMKGYYKNPEATAQVLTDDGWLHTGDMGKVDKSRTVYLRGRCKNMILTSSGQNIYPEEIEAKLNSTAFVCESIVVRRDGKLVALVYPDYEAAEAAGINDDGLQEVMDMTLREVNAQLAAYARLARIQLVPTEFEKTPKKSIKRYLYNV